MFTFNYTLCLITVIPALACENLMLALRAYGYDSCPMEGMDSKRIKNRGQNTLLKPIIMAGPVEPIYSKKRPYFTTPKSIILKHLKCNILLSKLVC